MCVLDSRILLYVSSCSLLVYKNCRLLLITACSELHKVLFLALSVTFLFVFEISWGNRWMDLRQIHMEDVFGPSLGQV